jgi:hypothetical protein
MTKLEFFERCARNALRVSYHPLHENIILGFRVSTRLDEWSDGSPSAVLHLKYSASFQDDKAYFDPRLKE